MRNKAEAAAEVTAIVKFLVDVDGKSYPCDRRVSGRTRKRQRIFVAGIGSQADPTSYLAGKLTVPAMEEMARTIARELIEEAPERVG
jgi:hypothetical protein